MEIRSASADMDQDIPAATTDDAGEITRWNRYDGRLGNPPEWYFLIEHARYLGVAPWELEQHPEWIERSKIAQLGELRAELAKRQGEHVS
jgi:hypothetical protein